MAESWGFSQQAVGAGGGEISPGVGSTGFSSRSVVFANASGQLTAAAAGPTWDSTQQFLGLGTTGPAARLHLAGTSGVVTDLDVRYQVGGEVGQAWLEGVGSSLSGFPNSFYWFDIVANAVRARITSAGDFQLGTSDGVGTLQFLSSVNVTTNGPSSGGATALPANPMLYQRVVVRNKAGTTVGGWIPIYATNSTAT